MSASRVEVGLCFDPRVLKDPTHASALDSLDLLVFPELVDGGYAAIAHGEGSHTKGDPLWRTFQQGSRDFSLCCVGGSMMLARSGGVWTNTSPVFLRGRLRQLYDKIHLFRPAEDHRFFVRGHEIKTFSFPAGQSSVKAGLILCYDLRFPEMVRALALRRIAVLVIPARWPSARDRAWRVLLQARAIENQLFVVGCNAPDDEGGNSYVVDPFGEVIFSSTDVPSAPLYRVRLQLDRIAEAHAHHRNLSDAIFLRYTKLPRIIPAPGSRKRRAPRHR